MDREDRLAGALLGAALGDALGLPFEGMSRERLARAPAVVDRFRLVGRTGFVSDDTEQSALVVEAVLEAKGDDARCLRRLRRSLAFWMARLPFGIGGATLRACLRMILGRRRTGIASAGNGAAMRAGVLGVCLADDAGRRRRLGPSLAALTHTDERAIQAALFVAELAALCARSSVTGRAALVMEAAKVLDHPELREAITNASKLAEQPLAVAVRRCGNTGFVVHTVGLCTYCFMRYGDTPLEGIEAAIRAGGDTDTHAAIVGGWLGALHGAGALPSPLLADLNDGPFGPTHLRRLAEAYTRGAAAPRWSALHALLRNVALYPVVLGHGVVRIAQRLGATPR
ncbi:MAG: ADP-ribosylglycohydrolase family protein [Myxococcota bacterium]